MSLIWQKHIAFNDYLNGVKDPTLCFLFPLLFNDIPSAGIKDVLTMIRSQSKGGNTVAKPELSYSISGSFCFLIDNCRRK